MITYKAIFIIDDDGVHAELLDFPGVITCGKDLDEARSMVRSALVDMAESNILDGIPLPRPNPGATDPEADLEEPVHLLLTAAFRVATQPLDAASLSVSTWFGTSS